MSETTDKHLEHAEHMRHAAHNPLDRLIAMTMAIVAAALALATMLSHRGHNEVLRLETLANTNHTKASDQWAYYQAQNIRSHTYQTHLLMLMMMDQADSTKRQPIEDFWTNQVNKYEGPDYWKHRKDEILAGKSGSSEGKEGSLAKIREKAEGLVEEAKHHEEESEYVHHCVNWLDYGELALELALVLCSIAVLTKLQRFWILGIAVAVGGSGLVVFGVYLLNVAGH